MATPTYAYATGLNGTRYDFKVYPAGTQFHPFSGLYGFLRPVANGGWHVLYIGQTHDLQMRVGAGLQNHHQFSAARRLGFTHVGVHVFQGNEQARLGAESSLIAALRPQLNGNGGQSIKPTLRFV